MTVDAKSAVAALLSAKDIEALTAAVEAASFLDATPGEDRQKLRGALNTLGPQLPAIGGRSAASGGWSYVRLSLRPALRLPPCALQPPA